MKRLMRTALALVFASITSIALLAGCAPNGLGISPHKLKTENKVDEFAFDEFANIDADLAFGEIELKQGSSYSVTVERRDYPEVEVEVANGKLVVAGPDGSWDANDSACAVTICVPKSAQLNDVELESQVGSVTVEGIATNEMKATATVGEVVVRKCTANTFTLTSDVGSVELRDVKDLKDASIDAEVELGSLTVGGTEYDGESFSQSGSGTKIKAKVSTGSMVIE